MDGSRDTSSSDDPTSRPTSGSGVTHTRRSSLLALLVVVALVLAVWLVNGGDPGTPTSTSGDATSESAGDTRDPGETTYVLEDDGDLPVVDLAELPPEAAEILELIDAGGPFAEDEDGSTFNNYESLLPERERGYYQEYTVPTPGSDDRGARRIVTGVGGELFWTADHYGSFARIVR